MIRRLVLSRDVCHPSTSVELVLWSINMDINFAPIFVLTAILCGIAARLWLRYSIAKSAGVAAIALAALYGLFFLAFAALKWREGRV
jgi:hypothetical protein